MKNVNVEFGILIHQLQDHMEKAIDFLPRDICHRNWDSDNLGLRVYFSKQESAFKCMRKENIKVNGIYYYIYPLVTCVTISSIENSASHLTIEDIVKTIRMPIVDHYRVIGGHHRVVLDVPEVQANINLATLLPENLRIYPIAFYCRLCRQEGHKQYQCPNIRFHSSSRHSDTSHLLANAGRMEENSNSYTLEGQNRRIVGIHQKQRNSSSQNTVYPILSNSRRLHSNYDNHIAQQENNADLIQRSNLDSPNLRNAFTTNQNVKDPVPSTSRTPTAAEQQQRTSHPAMKLPKVTKEGIQTKRQCQRTKSRTKKNISRKTEFPSNATKKVIYRTKGILPPEKMIQFLNHVKGKHYPAEVVKEFTPNKPALIKQLKAIKTTYLQFPNNTDVNKDLKIIDSLLLRL